jgi:hypothetical protein
MSSLNYRTDPGYPEQEGFLCIMCKKSKTLFYIPPDLTLNQK